MGATWEQEDVDDMLEDFGVDCLYYQAWHSPGIQHGRVREDPKAIHGYRYRAPVNVKLIRTAVSNFILNLPEGKIYKGGARFTVPKNRTINGTVVTQDIFERVFMGDIIVVKEKPIRDFDILTRGKRDSVFAFDVYKIISVVYVKADGTAVFYEYGTDFTVRSQGVELVASVDADGSISFSFPADLIVTFGDDSLFGDFRFNQEFDATLDVTNMLEIVWTDGGNAPPDGQNYTVEFLTSPNYVVWDDLAKPRGTWDNDLPKMIMCVKRAFVTQQANPIDTVNTRENVMDVPATNLDSEF